VLLGEFHPERRSGHVAVGSFHLSLGTGFTGALGRHGIATFHGTLEDRLDAGFQAALPMHTVGAAWARTP